MTPSTPSTPPSVQARRAAILREALHAASVIEEHARLGGMVSVVSPLGKATTKVINAQYERIAIAQADLSKLEEQA